MSLSQRLRDIAEVIKGLELNLPITSQEDLLEASRLLEKQEEEHPHSSVCGLGQFVRRDQ